MPAILEDGDMASTPSSDGPSKLPFPPVTQEHILHCSYHHWWPKYRNITPKTRIIPLSRPFLDYLRADGIILPDDEDSQPQWDSDSGVFSASDNPDALDESDDEEVDVTAGWQDIHTTIRETIDELDGRVMPKLNWSAPKDATWMNANTMMCHKPSEIYLLLKSSDFVTHDLEHPFDDTITLSGSPLTKDTVPYHLVLRKGVPAWNPSVEFRCFVRNRRLLCICQRDLNHYDFLFKMEGRLRSLIQDFFDIRLRNTFTDDNFAFDVYIPDPFTRVWLVDINPWAPRTDPLLFSWMEILDMPDPPDSDPEVDYPEFVRIPLSTNSNGNNIEILEEMRRRAQAIDDANDANHDDDGSDTDDTDDTEDVWLPELRLVRRTDPEAYQFNTPQYSAHKLPKDVVDASQSGEGLREFARDWENILARRRAEEEQLAENSEED